MSGREAITLPALGSFWIYAGTTGSLLLRLSVLDFESGDYRQFLSNWYDQFVELGRWNALADDFSSYPPLYLYFLSLSTLLPLPKLYAIKLISIVADYVAAWFVFRLVRCRWPEGCLPWAAAIATLFLPWGRQENHPLLTLGATNWYQWISNGYYGVFFQAGIVLAIVGTAFLILAMQAPAAMERPLWFVTTALISVMMVPYFLPGMHERYFFAADLFALVYAFFVTRGWVVAVLVQFCSFFTYLPYLFEMEPLPRPLLAVVMTAAVGMVVAQFLSACGKDSKSSVPPEAVA